MDEEDYETIKYSEISLEARIEGISTLLPIMFRNRDTLIDNRILLENDLIIMKTLKELKERLVPAAKHNCEEHIIRYHESAYCFRCKSQLGWWCPTSPNNLCEYSDPTSEGCIHCGEPEERK